MHVLVLNWEDKLVSSPTGYGYVIYGDLGTGRKEACPSHPEPAEGSVEAFIQTRMAESWHKSVKLGRDALEENSSDNGIVIAGQTAE